MATLDAWEEYSADTTCVPKEFSSQVIAAVQQLREQIRAHASSKVDSAKRALMDTLPHLQEMAGGSPNISWKATLTAQSPWDDVMKEATYHLFANGRTPSIKDRLTPLYAATLRAHEGYKSAIKWAESIDRDTAFSVDTALEERCSKALATSLVTDTEAYFVEQLSSGRNDKIATRLRTRIASMLKKNVDPSDIQEAVWKRVQQLVG